MRTFVKRARQSAELLLAKALQERPSPGPDLIRRIVFALGRSNPGRPFGHVDAPSRRGSRCVTRGPPACGLAQAFRALLSSSSSCHGQHHVFLDRFRAAVPCARFRSEDVKRASTVAVPLQPGCRFGRTRADRRMQAASASLRRREVHATGAPVGLPARRRPLLGRPRARGTLWPARVRCGPPAFGGGLAPGAARVERWPATQARGRGRPHGRPQRPRRGDDGPLQTVNPRREPHFTPEGVQIPSVWVCIGFGQPRSCPRCGR